MLTFARNDRQHRLLHGTIQKATHGPSRSAPANTADLVQDEIESTVYRLIAGAEEAERGLSFVSGLSGFPLGPIPWKARGRPGPRGKPKLPKKLRESE